MILIDRYFYSILQKIRQGYLKRLKNDGSVLMFHIIKSEKNVWPNPDITISVETFEKLLEIIQKHFKIIPVDQICNSSETPNVIISFDDASDDVYYNAFPILKRLQIPFIIFVTYNFIDKKGYLSKKMILEIDQSNLCTWGYHTLNHKLMRQLNNKEMIEEIEVGLHMFERLLKKEIAYFAFPYGSSYAVSNKNIAYLNKQNFKFLFMSWKTHYNISYIVKTKLVPRINVNEKIGRKYINEATY